MIVSASPVRSADAAANATDAGVSGTSASVDATTAAAVDAAALYAELRRRSPAPYAAFMRLGGGGPTLCCASVERFLRLDRDGALDADEFAVAMHLTRECTAGRSLPATLPADVCPPSKRHLLPS